MTEVKHVIAAPKMARQNVMILHRGWFNIIEEMRHMAGVVPCLPRLCSHQWNRSNVPAENASDYYRQVISIPLLGHPVSEHFNSHNQAALQGLYLVSSVLVTVFGGDYTRSSATW